MAVIKIALCMLFVVTVVYAKDLRTRTTNEDVAANKSKQNRAVVIDSNLPLSDQTELAEGLQEIYDTEEEDRVTPFFLLLLGKYGSSNVFVNYDLALYDHKNYIIISIDGDKVLAFVN